MGMSDEDREYLNRLDHELVTGEFDELERLWSEDEPDEDGDANVEIESSL